MASILDHDVLAAGCRHPGAQPMHRFGLAEPGDVIMPKMGNMDINKMMKDPKFQKMMREQQEQ